MGGWACGRGHFHRAAFDDHNYYMIGIYCPKRFLAQSLAYRIDCRVMVSWVYWRGGCDWTSGWWGINRDGTWFLDDEDDQGGGIAARRFRPKFMSMKERAHLLDTDETVKSAAKALKSCWVDVDSFGLEWFRSEPDALNQFSLIAEKVSRIGRTLVETTEIGWTNYDVEERRHLLMLRRWYSWDPETQGKLTQCLLVNNLKTSLWEGLLFDTYLPKEFKGCLYHGTTLLNCIRIRHEGFKASKSGALGPGVYLSPSLKKATAYPKYKKGERREKDELDVVIRAKLNKQPQHIAVVLKYDAMELAILREADAVVIRSGNDVFAGKLPEICVREPVHVDALEFAYSLPDQEEDWLAACFFPMEDLASVSASAAASASASSNSTAG